MPERRRGRGGDDDSEIGGADWLFAQLSDDDDDDVPLPANSDAVGTAGVTPTDLTQGEPTPSSSGASPDAADPTRPIPSEPVRLTPPAPFGSAPAAPADQPQTAKAATAVPASDPSYDRWRRPVPPPTESRVQNPGSEGQAPVSPPMTSEPAPGARTPPAATPATASPAVPVEPGPAAWSPTAATPPAASPAVPAEPGPAAWWSPSASPLPPAAPPAAAEPPTEGWAPPAPPAPAASGPVPGEQPTATPVASAEPGPTAWAQPAVVPADQDPAPWTPEPATPAVPTEPEPAPAPAVPPVADAVPWWAAEHLAASSAQTPAEAAGGATLAASVPPREDADAGQTPSAQAPADPAPTSPAPAPQAPATPGSAEAAVTGDPLGPDARFGAKPDERREAMPPTAVLPVAGAAAGATSLGAGWAGSTPATPSETPTPPPWSTAAPSDPVPSNPVQSNPAATNPASSNPASSNPASSNPASSNPVPSNPAPSNPAPSSAEPSSAAPSNAAPWGGVLSGSAPIPPADPPSASDSSFPEAPSRPSDPFPLDVPSTNRPVDEGSLNDGADSDADPDEARKLVWSLFAADEPDDPIVDASAEPADRVAADLATGDAPAEAPAAPGFAWGLVAGDDPARFDAPPTNETASPATPSSSDDETARDALTDGDAAPTTAVPVYGAPFVPPSVFAPLVTPTPAPSVWNTATPAPFDEGSADVETRVIPVPAADAGTDGSSDARRASEPGEEAERSLSDDNAGADGGAEAAGIVASGMEQPVVSDNDPSLDETTPVETSWWIDSTAASPAVSAFDFPPVEAAAVPTTPAAVTPTAVTSAAATPTPATPPPATPTSTTAVGTTPAAVTLTPATPTSTTAVGTTPAPMTPASMTPASVASESAADEDGVHGLSNRTLLLIAAGLGAVLVLVLLFWVGTRLPGLGAPVAAPTPSATKSATPTPTPEVTGPAAAGVHPWDQLGGGECVDPFTGPWGETFTVVDCAAPHAAQLVYRGTFGGDATTAFPGEDALAGQINALCSASGVIDMTAAGAYPDLQLQGSFPITAEQWKDTKRYYYCFVSRSGGEPITATIAGPGPAPAA